MVKENKEITRIDQLIGNKVFLLRTASGLTRNQLSGLIDVSNQQLHKYEKGVNRISVGRLVLIAKALDKNINYFYQDLNSEDDSAQNNNLLEKKPSEHKQLLCIKVAHNFMKIKDSKQQDAVNQLIKSLAEAA